MSDLSAVRIPVEGARRVRMRWSALPREGEFLPGMWPETDLVHTGAGWYEVRLDTLGLPDGGYEYEFLIDRDGEPTFTAADPYAEEITRFAGYRGVFRIRRGRRERPPFNWDGELWPGVRLPGNHEMVIYELPMRWVDSAAEGYDRQVGLGTFDKAIFERLDYLADLGVNAVELLPAQDSPDTLNWGYGTRFFFAPDFDMGGAFDLKLFVKRCHQRGIRVILDVVMNHSRGCPLERLAFDTFYLRSGDEETDHSGSRPDWGGRIFRYREERNGAHHGRLFHYGMAEYWIREYHVDGFRIDEFKGIQNWDFLREFRRRAHRVQRDAFPGRPFVVIAEDSWRRAEVTHGENGPASDAIWDFDFRDELRRLLTDDLGRERASRVQAMIRGDGAWNDMGDGGWRGNGFRDLACRVTYCTSHDVQEHLEKRLFPFFLDEAGGPAADGTAGEQVVGAFALMLTAAGIPMFLAGEEFADLHDTDHADWRMKMSDPVDWSRAGLPGHAEILARVKSLIRLRTGHAALQRNEVKFFGMNRGFHPTFEAPDGERVFAYCRTGGKPLGSAGQVVVVANASRRSYPVFRLPWPWGGSGRLEEHGGAEQPLPDVRGHEITLALRPFQVRVFEE